MAAETAVRDADYVATMMAVSLGAPHVSTNLWIDEVTHRLLVNASLAADAGKTLLSVGGSVSSSGNNTLLTPGATRLKVFAFSLTTTSTTAVVCKITNGNGGAVLWQDVLQAPTGVTVGANLATTPPASLFATGSATALVLNIDSAQTVHYGLSYFDEA